MKIALRDDEAAVAALAPLSMGYDFWWRSPNFVLLDDRACWLARYLDTGRYEIHTYIDPDLGGDLKQRVAREALAFAFTKLGVLELTTFVMDNRPAAIFAQWCGFRKRFTTQRDGKEIRFMSMTIEDWIEGERYYKELGQEFHERLALEVGVDHPPDAIHDAWVGTAIAMFKAGLPEMAVAVYNRFAHMCFYRPISFEREHDTILVDIGTCKIRVLEEDFTIEVHHA